MIFDIDLEDVSVGDHLILTVEVVGKLERPNGAIFLKFKPITIPQEVGYDGNSNVSFEASSHPIKLF